MTRLFIPELNPVKLFKATPATPAAYNYKHMDDWEFAKTIPDFQQSMDYLQPWQQSDTIYLQVQSDASPLNVSVVDDATGKVMLTQAFTQAFQNADDPTLWVCRCGVALNSLPAGVYRLKLVTPVGLVLLSNRLDVCASLPHTLLLSYSHFEYHNGMFFFGNLPDFQIRIEGTLKYRPPASKDILFEDQPLNETLIASKPYRLWQLVVGDSYGVPPYLIDKLNQVLGCSNVQIDGRYYSKADGAKWEEKTQEDYPMAGYTIELREQYNRNSIAFEDATQVTAGVQIIAVVDAKGFGGSGTYNIIDVE